MFGKRKVPAIPEKSFDREKYKPVIRASICNGEQVAGLKEIATGKFSEEMLLRDEEDLRIFMKQYGIGREEITKEY